MQPLCICYSLVFRSLSLTAAARQTPAAQVQYMTSALLSERDQLQGEVEFLRGLMAQVARLQASASRAATTASGPSSRRSSASFASDYPPGSGVGSGWQWMEGRRRAAGPGSVGGLLLRAGCLPCRRAAL
jgi:hypothetical protein